MEVSLLLMEQIAQLFIVLLMGYIVVKAKLLKPSDSKVLSVVFVYLIMPCVVLNAFQIDDTPVALQKNKKQIENRTEK